MVFRSFKNCILGRLLLYSERGFFFSSIIFLAKTHVNALLSCCLSLPRSLNVKNLTLCHKGNICLVMHLSVTTTILQHQ